MLLLGGQQVVEQPEQAEHLDGHPVLFAELPHDAVLEPLAELQPAARKLPGAGLVPGGRSPLGEEEPRAGPRHHGAGADSYVVTAGYEYRVSPVCHLIFGMMSTSPRIQIVMVTATMNTITYVSYQR